MRLFKNMRDYVCALQLSLEATAQHEETFPV